MQSDVLWRRELLYNGVVVQANAYLWGPNGDGDFVFFFSIPGGFANGSYEIRLYIGSSSRPIAIRAFSVIGP